ncbi:MAG: thioredoxin [Oscillospiraceae bacterium]
MSAVINKDSFETQVLESDIPVLVDFFATWCGPCRMLSPTVEEIAEEYKGRINVYKVDIDADPELAMSYGIMSVPTLMVFKGGKAVRKVVGVRPKEEITALFE